MPKKPLLGGRKKGKLSKDTFNNDFENEYKLSNVVKILDELKEVKFNAAGERKLKDIIERVDRLSQNI